MIYPKPRSGLLLGMAILLWMTLHSGCSPDNPSRSPLVRLEYQVDEHIIAIQLDTIHRDPYSNASRVILSVFQDSLMTDADVLVGCDVSGLGNHSIHTTELDGNPETPEFAVITGVYGATFGAEELSLVFRQDRLRGWRIIPSPFVEPEIVDIEGDGVFEIVEYYQASRPTGDVYRFLNGGWVPDSNVVFRP